MGKEPQPFTINPYHFMAGPNVIAANSYGATRHGLAGRVIIASWVKNAQLTRESVWYDRALANVSFRGLGCTPDTWEAF